LCNTRDEFIRETRRQCKRGVDLIKIADSNWSDVQRSPMTRSPPLSMRLTDTTSKSPFTHDLGHWRGGRPDHRRLPDRRAGVLTKSQRHRWDSSPKIRFALDSPLEGTGFEPSVPRGKSPTCDCNAGIELVSWAVFPNCDFFRSLLAIFTSITRAARAISRGRGRPHRPTSNLPIPRSGALGVVSQATRSRSSTSSG
jgi:hypothetical protein